MPFDSQGSATVTRQLAVTGQNVLAEQVNVPFADIQSMLSQTFLRSGLAPATGPFNLNGFKLINVGDASNDGDAVSLAFLNSLIANLGTVPVGAIQPMRTKVAPAGWLIEDGKTIGNAASGATGRANADTVDLFTHLWTQFTNTELPIQTSAGAASTRGGSAAADFAANKRMPLFDSRTRFLRGSDSGLGFDPTLVPGLSQDDIIKNHKHSGETNEDGDHTHGYLRGIGGSGLGAEPGTDGATSGTTTGTGRHKHAYTTNDNTGGSTLETRPRSSVVLYCIKL